MKILRKKAKSYIRSIKNNKEITQPTEVRVPIFIGFYIMLAYYLIKPLF